MRMLDIMLWVFIVSAMFGLDNTIKWNYDGRNHSLTLFQHQGENP